MPAGPPEAAAPPVVAVACSGGRDSIALLHATQAAAAPLGVRVVALHVHHGLMAEADAWEAGVAAFCAGRGIGFASARLGGSPARGESVEAWARRARYAALARLARAQGAGLVLLAHHRRDQAETVLLQALRGAGPAGLAAMPRVVEREGLAWARPWLDEDDAAIEAYARAAALPRVDDPSNADSRFARSRLRAAVMPALRAAFPQAEAALAAAARRAHEARSVLDEVAHEDLARLGAHQGRLPIAAWQALSAARRANALRAWLASQARGPVPETLLERVQRELASQATRRWPLEAGRGLRAWRGTLEVVALAAAGEGDDAGAFVGAAATGTPLRLLRCDAYAVDGWPGRLEVRAVEREGVSPRRLAQAVARARIGGERFQRTGGGLARSLKKQFQAAGVAEEARAGPLVFDTEGHLLYVPGLGMDARAWAGEGAPQWALHWHPAEA